MREQQELEYVQELLWRSAKAQLIAWWLDKMPWVDEPSDADIAEANRQADRILRATE